MDPKIHVIVFLIGVVLMCFTEVHNRT